MSRNIISTREIFAFRSSEHRAALQAVMALPAVKEALRCLRTSLVPTQVPGVASGVHHDTTIAHHFHALMHGNVVINTLEAMAQPIGKSDHELGDLMEFTPPEYQNDPNKTQASK